MIRRYSLAPDGWDSRPWVIWDNQPTDGSKYALYQNSDGKPLAFATQEDACELLHRLNGENQ